ncbi:MAG: diacylglycerol kinase [Nocardioidaceae bacterium]|nr:diacylglycerol kinase [Nocardioidaceae bacterium]
MKNIVLITNVGSGTHDEEIVQSAADRLGESLSVEVVATCDRGELDTTLAALGDRDLVVAGGDGSLHMAVASLHSQGILHDTRVGLIPLGTGNDFARGAHIPLDHLEAADVITAGRDCWVDILVDDSGNVVVNAAHIGVGADAGIEARAWKAALNKVNLGKVGYAVGAVVAGFKTTGYHLKVVADGEVLTDGSRRVLQVGVGNGSRIGGGTRLTPDANPTDGFANVIVSFAVAPRDRFLYGVHLKRGTHDERGDVVTARARQVEVSGEPFYCNTDGELIGPLRDRTWTVQPQAFRMALPTASQAADD